MLISSAFLCVTAYSGACRKEPPETSTVGKIGCRAAFIVDMAIIVTLLVVGIVSYLGLSSPITNAPLLSSSAGIAFMCAAGGLLVGNISFVLLICAVGREMKEHVKIEEKRPLFSYLDIK